MFLSHIDVTLPLFLPPFPSLKSVRMSLSEDKKKKKKEIKKKEVKKLHKWNVDQEGCMCKDNTE